MAICQSSGRRPSTAFATAFSCSTALDPAQLLSSNVPFLQDLGTAYVAYRDALRVNNRVDFAHLQSMVHTLLADGERGPKMTSEIRHILVDEYQDTNYVQE